MQVAMKSGRALARVCSFGRHTQRMCRLATGLLFLSILPEAGASTVHYTLSNVSAILNGKLETMTGSFVYNSTTNLVTQISFDFLGLAIDGFDNGSLFTQASEANYGLVNAGVLQGYDVYAFNALGSAGAVFLASPLGTLGSIAVNSVQYSSPSGGCSGGYACSNFAIAGSFVVGTAVPEPGSLALAATALIGLGALRRRAEPKTAIA